MTRLQDFLNTPMKDLVKAVRAPKAGDLFGVELECEGRRVDYNGDNDMLRHWAPHNDGSLRNNHGASCEWVFNGPVKHPLAIERINILFDYFKKNESKLVCSNRTSCHVHFNMGDKTGYQVVNMYILFTILEGLLDRYCGEDREGNLFCLSSRFAETQVNWVHDACFKHYNFAHFGDNLRYSSFNLAALNKFGTVEFRGMRGLDNREDVIAWLNIINEFSEYACYKMRNPVDVIRKISAETPVGFLKTIFSDKNIKLLTKGLTDQEISQSMYEGLRLVQMLCYKIGTEFEQVRLRGRDFWASFKNDQEPELDVDPEDFKRAGGVPLGGRRDPFANLRPRADIRQADLAEAALRIAALDEDGPVPPVPWPMKRRGKAVGIGGDGVPVQPEFIQAAQDVWNARQEAIIQREVLDDDED